MRSGNDIQMATKAAECMKIISQLGERNNGDHVKDGLGNFRFCATACCKPHTPFFPAAMGQSLSSSKVVDEDVIPFSIGLENGKLANVLLQQSATIDNIGTIFKDGMTDALHPIQTICETISNSSINILTGTVPDTDIDTSTLPIKRNKCSFMGIDTSLNPSLDENGSIGDAMEQINTLQQFGGPGSIAVAAEITKALKSLPNIKKVGYCGLMLPVCEDRRLATLASSNDIDTTKLLAISSVCGVGLDTIPVPDCQVESLSSLILDVASLSFRYEKSLSCRLLICPGSKEGDETNFNSPYMCECKIFKV